MKLLNVFATVLACGGCVSTQQVMAADYSFSPSYQHPTFSSGVLTNPYGPDTLIFTLGDVVYPLNTWVYQNQVTLTIEGELTPYPCGRCVPLYKYTTMPKADGVQLMAVDASGNQTPALDVNGNTVPITYSPQNFGTFRQLDRWVATGALPAGTYTVTGISGASCGSYNVSTGVCGSEGGGNWLAVFHPTYIVIPTPCTTGCGD